MDSLRSPLPPTPLLQVCQVSHQFAASSQTVLTEINLHVYPGDRIALIGPSGAGKSTLLSLLNGSLSPTSGAIWSFGQNLARASPRRRRTLQRQIGTIYQQFHLVPSLRVIHNVNAGRLGQWSWLKALWSLVVPQGIDQAQTALAQVGIPEVLFARTDQLSGGQQQRVAIARILLQNPQIILADEPIASLDPERSREVMTLLAELSGSSRSLVVSLHDLAMAREFCDRIVGLRQGRILFDLPTAQLQPAHLETLYQLTP